MTAAGVLVSDEVTVSPSELREELLACVRARRPAIVLSAPGIGKSQIVAQLANELFAGLHAGYSWDAASNTVTGPDGRQVANGRQPWFRDVRAVLRDPTDFVGMPSVRDGRTFDNPRGYLPVDGHGILFLDELMAAPQLTQNALLQLTLDRQLGEYVLPDGWHVIAAGNRATDRAGSGRLTTALGSRLAQFTLRADLDEWRAWAIRAGLRPEVIAFVSARPNLLHAFDSAATAFPCPRSWQFASELLHASESDRIATYAAVIGVAAAREFVAFLRTFRRIPTLAEICADPAAAIVPDQATETDALYAVALMLAKRATADRMDSIVAYCERLPGEFRDFAVRTMIQRDAGLAETAAYVRYALAHQAED